MEISLAELGLLSTFCILVLGLLCRLGALNHGIKNLFFLPYPAVLIMLGIFFGYLTFTTPELDKLGSFLERIDRLPGMNMFLPAFCFKTVFLMEWQDFRACWTQVFVLGLFGFLATSLITGAFFSAIIHAPFDSVDTVLLYGAVVSIIDPGDHFSDIAQLRQLRTILDGEALFNTAIGVLIFTQGVVQKSADNDYSLTQTSPYFMVFINIAVGFVLAKVFVIFLKYKKTDFNTFICVSLAAGYLLFNAMEIFFSFGLISLIVFAMIICPPHKTALPDTEITVLTQFWTALYYVANTLVCVFAGILFGRAFVFLNAPQALGSMIAFYVVVQLTRCVVVIILSPVLDRLGFGLDWRRALIMMWAGMRSSVSLGLLCCIQSEQYRQKFQAYGIGMILLNQLVNGSTLRCVLIGLGQMTRSKVSSLDTVLKFLEDEKNVASNVLYSNALFADAQWATIAQATTLCRSNFPRNEFAMVESSNSRNHDCDACLKQVPEQLKQQNVLELENAARKKILQAQKVSYTRQHASELLSSEAHQVLCAAIEGAYHWPVPSLRPPHLQRHWAIDGIETKIYSFVLRTFPDRASSAPKLFENHWFLLIMRTVAWEWSVVVTVLIQAAHFFWKLTLEVPPVIIPYGPFSIVFFWVIFYQFVAEVTIYSWDRTSGRLPFIFLDALTLVISFIHIVTRLLGLSQNTILLFSALRLVRLVRLFRLFSLIRKTLPYTSKWLHNLVTRRILIGFDIGKGFVLGNEDALKMLPHMVKHSEVMAHLRQELEEDRLTAVRQLEELTRLWPIPISSLKTRQCAQGLVRRMHTRALELSAAGMLDDDELAHVLKEFAELRTRMDHDLVVVGPRTSNDVLSQLPWLANKLDVIKSLLAQSVIWRWNSGHVVIRQGDDLQGLIIVCSGLLRCDYTPPPNVEQLIKSGVLLNYDHPRHINYTDGQEEYAREGNVLGEIGVLTGRNSDVIVTCVTSVVMTFIPTAALESQMTPEIRRAMWRTVGIRLAALLLQETPGYETWPKEKIRLWLDRSIAPDISSASLFDTCELAQCVVVISGVVQDSDTGAFYTAPCVLPSLVKKINPNVILPDLEDMVSPQLLVVPADDLEVHVVPAMTSDGLVKLQADVKLCSLHEPSKFFNV